MKTQISTEVVSDKIELIAPYCALNNPHYRSHGGKYGTGKWSFKNGSKSAEELIGTLFGHSSELVIIQISSDDELIRKSVDELAIGGYKLAGRRKRDWSVEMPEGVWLENGFFESSGGSAKNPALGPINDIVFRAVVRADFAIENELDIIEKIPAALSDTQRLLLEKEKLLQRITEIDLLLENSE